MTNKADALFSVEGAAGAYENVVLYRMCHDAPGHGDAFVTAGKIVAIGRIYSASPERGAGSARTPGQSLARTIAEALSLSRLDGALQSIGSRSRFSLDLLEPVVEAHHLLVSEIKAAIRRWSASSDDPKWNPRRCGSFGSKYLHFHRPMAFPIMDSFARAGLRCSGRSGALDGYRGFCRAFLDHVHDRKDGWTPRSIDIELVERGREHLGPGAGRCGRCGSSRTGR